MQKKKNYLMPFAVIMTLLFVMMCIHDVWEAPTNVVPEGYVSSDALDAAVNAKALEVTEEKALEITELASQLATKTVEVEEEVKESLGYLIDGIFFGEEVLKDLSDREISTLFDGEIDFDGDDYDVEEVFSISLMKVLSNEEDFEGTSYLVVPEDSVEYTVVFDSALNTGLIEEDETMVFNFLGKEVEVIEWDVGEVTFTQGESFDIIEGEVITFGDKEISLYKVLDDEIYLRSGDQSISIEEDETKTLNGLEIKAENVLYDSRDGKVSMAEIVIAEDIELSIEIGDEFVEDSIWEWMFTSNSIGIVLKEEFMELDDELKPLAVDEKLCLPNEYVCIKFGGVLEEDVEEISFELDTKNSVEYVEVEGNFQSGLDDFSKLYVKRSDGTIYDKDLVEITEDITVGNFDSTFSYDGSNIVVEDFKVSLDLISSNVGNGDVDFMTDFGIFVVNPEDSEDDQEWTITIPENKLESNIIVM